TNKRLKLAPGTLYGAIKTMLDNKLISIISEDKQRKGKKVYEITRLGRKLIYYEIKRLKEMINNGIEQIGDYYE
ncbi:MAG: helix-turn-helix transcriptional regulator, partial [Candidatus Izimaplasma sp.]|nr:helix-turn-helix transcriptional regulator [Candidatus Izimaplasma bacterium]